MNYALTPYGYQQTFSQPQEADLSMESVISAFLAKLLISKDTTVNNAAARSGLNQLGDLFNDFKAQWNLVNPGFPITAADYVKV